VLGDEHNVFGRVLEFRLERVVEFVQPSAVRVSVFGIRLGIVAVDISEAVTDGFDCLLGSRRIELEVGTVTGSVVVVVTVLVVTGVVVLVSVAVVVLVFVTRDALR